MIWAQVLIVAALLILLGLRLRIAAIFIATLALIPLHVGVSTAMVLRGLWGDPSVTSLQLLVLFLCGRTPPSFRDGWRAPVIFSLFGLALYASALGPWNIDLYRFGYQPAYLTAALSIAVLAAWWRGRNLYIWIFAIDLIAWRAGLLESTNLWDTLLDPLLAFAMLALALRNGYRAGYCAHRNRKKLRAQP